MGGYNVEVEKINKARIDADKLQTKEIVQTFLGETRVDPLGSVQLEDISEEELLAGLELQPPVPQRKYLPTLSDLIDRLTIVQLKAVFIPERTAEYVEERALIEHDIDLILQGLAKKGKHISATEIHAIVVLMLSNRFIWENESKARAGGDEHDRLLKLTHSINGVRNTAKNQLAIFDGGRKDYKVDSFAASLVAEFGNWQIFE